MVKTNANPNSDNDDPSCKNSQTLPPDVATSRHASRYLIVGITLTIFNFVFYTILANLIFNDSNLLWLSTLISTLATTILAYLLHSKITWKERPLTKTAIYKFFIWNLATALIISPTLTWLFTFFSALYDFLFTVSSLLFFPFSHDFVESTSVFVLTTLVTMILNYIFYDRLVFK